MASRTGIQRGHLGGVATNHGDRIAAIEHRTTVDPSATRTRTGKLEVVDFCFDAPIVAGTSIIHPIIQGGRISVVKWRLVSAGGTGLAFRALINATPAGVTVTLPGSTPSGSATIGDSVFGVPDDDLQVEITSAGSGNARLTLQLFMVS